MSTSTRLTYNLFTYCTIFTKLTHVSTNFHHISTSLLFPYPYIKIRYALILFTSTHIFIAHLLTLYFYTFITTCFTQNTFIYTSYLYIHALLLPIIPLFQLFLPRLHATNNNTFSHYQRLNALFLLLFNPPTAPPYSPQSISPAAPSMLVDNLY